MPENDAGDGKSLRKISLQDAIHAAQHLQRTEKFAEAEDIYRQILDHLPDEPNALHFLGVLRHQQKRNDEAIDLIRRAAEHLPGEAGPWLNLGNVLLEVERFDDAVDAYKQAADCAPDNILIYTNLGVLHTRRGHFDLAETCYQLALKLAPQPQPELLQNYAMMLQRQGRFEEAVAYGLKSRDLNPSDPKGRRMLAMSYALLGDMDAARGVLRDWLAAQPDDPAALHFLASMGGAAPPARAADAYIVTEFDSFSKTFDAKLEALEYRAPEYVSDALKHAIMPAANAGDMLDAGCGTGLCAPRLRPMAARLDGVDLSAGMLALARKRGGYDSLTQEELTAFMARHTAHWDAIVSADTLCYFGDLSPVFAAAKAALRGGGWLVFSVEAHLQGEKDYVLTYNGRYEHTRDYLERSLRAAGLTPVSVEQKVLRTETLRPVQGWVVAARNNTAARN